MAADAQGTSATCSRNADAAQPSLVEAGEIAERFADADATMFAQLGHGYSLILQGQIAEGMALLDEGDGCRHGRRVSPMLAGIAYCQVIALCQAVFDLRRATGGRRRLRAGATRSPTSFPSGQLSRPSLRDLPAAGCVGGRPRLLRRACDWLAGPPAWDTLGSACQLAEIQRLRGELAEAEESYRRASLAGQDPEPGISLLRLAQRRHDLAVQPWQALEEAQDPIARSRLLPACIGLLEAEDMGAARVAADELAAIAAQFEAHYLKALAAHASGIVLLAEGDPRSALTKLRTAQRSWRDLEAPHQAARVRLLIRVACRAGSAMMRRHPLRPPRRGEGEVRSGERAPLEPEHQSSGQSRQGRRTLTALRVLIVGAGVAGLALAHALRQRSITAEVVERVSEWQPGGAGLYLPGNAGRALRELGVGSPWPVRRAIRRQRLLDDRLLAEIDVGRFQDGVGGCVAIQRAALHEALQDATQDVPVGSAHR